MHNIPSLKQSIESIHRRWPDLKYSDEDEPIFVMSAGWRSGSTWLQRMLLQHCFMWGEPWGHNCPIQSMSESVKGFTESWPETHHFYQGESSSQLEGKFIANLYPTVQALVDAHIAYFQTLYSPPEGTDRSKKWGIKEVRLSIDHARYLKWLFPKAKFLFLIRNPYDALKSYVARRDKGWNWYHHWPDKPLTTKEFGVVWKNLAEGFFNNHQDVDGCLIHYEKLKTESSESERVSEYLGFPLSEVAAAVSPSDSGPAPVPYLKENELRLLQRTIDPLASQLGYDPPQKALRLNISQGEMRNECVILVPVGSHIVPQTESGLRELERRGYKVRRVYGYSAIDQGRNQMATDALKDGFKETIWIDSDVVFDPDDVDKLRSHQEPFVMGVYPQKGKRSLACHVLPGTHEIQFGRRGGLIEILYASGGFSYVHSSVYKDVQNLLDVPVANEAFTKPMIPFFEPMIRKHEEGNWYLAEDFAFSHRAREAGYRIMADTTIRLWHVGNHAYSWEEAGIDRERFDDFKFKLH